MKSGDECTIYCGNLNPNVTEELLYELFLQAGPLKGVKIPKNANSEKKQFIFGFVDYQHECSVDYAIQLFQGTSLLGQELQLQRKNSQKSAKHQEHKNAAYHHINLPNLITGMFPQGTFPVIQPQVQLFRPPGYFYPPMNPVLSNYPAYMNGFSSGFPAPLYHGLHRDVSLPLPPGESNSYRGNRHHSGASHHKRFHDERIGSNDYQPVDKRTKLSDPSTSRPFSKDENYRYSERNGGHSTRFHQHDDSHRESRSHHKDDSRADRFRQRDNHAEKSYDDSGHQGAYSYSKYKDHNGSRRSTHQESHNIKDRSSERRTSMHHMDSD